MSTCSDVQLSFQFQSKSPKTFGIIWTNPRETGVEVWMDPCYVRFCLQGIRPCSTVNEKVHGPFGPQDGPNLFSEEPRYAWGISWRMPTLWKVTCQNHIAKL